MTDLSAPEQLAKQMMDVVEGQEFFFHCAQEWLSSPLHKPGDFEDEDDLASFFALPHFVITATTLEILAVGMAHDSVVWGFMNEMIGWLTEEHEEFLHGILFQMIRFAGYLECHCRMRAIDQTNLSAEDREELREDIRKAGVREAELSSEGDWLDLEKRISMVNGGVASEIHTIYLVGYVFRREPELWREFQRLFGFLDE